MAPSAQKQEKAKSESTSSGSGGGRRSAAWRGGGGRPRGRGCRPGGPPTIRAGALEAQETWGIPSNALPAPRPPTATAVKARPGAREGCGRVGVGLDSVLGLLCPDPWPPEGAAAPGILAPGKMSRLPRILCPWEVEVKKGKDAVLLVGLTRGP